MTTKFTPGPWKSGDSDWHLIVGPSTRFRDLSHRSLAAIATVEESENGMEDLANCKLIMAAPDLLSALQACVIYIEGVDVPDAELDPLAKAKLAIAKAEGR